MCREGITEAGISGGCFVYTSRAAVKLNLVYSSRKYLNNLAILRRTGWPSEFRWCRKTCRRWSLFRRVAGKMWDPEIV